MFIRSTDYRKNTGISFSKTTHYKGISARLGALENAYLDALIKDHFWQVPLINEIIQ